LPRPGFNDGAYRRTALLDDGAIICVVMMIAHASMMHETSDAAHSP
jgi:hypothetical protein